MDESDSDLEAVLTGGGSINNNGLEDCQFHDSDYSFSQDSDEERRDTSEAQRAMVAVTGEPPNIGAEAVVESDYATSEELISCSSTDEDELVTSKPNNSEFNEDCDMKNPEFKIGMKFRSLDQFKEAVRNYGIKHGYAMNFRPNSKKKMQGLLQKRLSILFMGIPYGE